MEYCEHGDLNKYIKSVGKLTEKETKDIIWQVLGGLSLMHESKFAHRDIKPAVSLLRGARLNKQRGAATYKLGTRTSSLRVAHPRIGGSSSAILG